MQETHRGDAGRADPCATPVQARLLCVAFFASGAAGLLFEVLWFYKAGLALGNGFWAAAAVMAAFMGGLAIGNWCAVVPGRWAVDPVRTYAALEVAIGLIGVVLVFVLPSVGQLLAPVLGAFLDQPAAANLLRFSLAFVLLLVPCSAMGLTLPLLTQALSREASAFGHILGRLYGLNTLGAVAGGMVGELVLLDRLGIRGTAMVAALLNLTAAGAAGWLSRRSAPVCLSEAAPFRESVFTRSLVPCWLAVALSGFLLLALEVVWIRFLSLFLTNSTLAFATMLSIVLAGIALGGLGASTILRRFAGAGGFTGSIPFLAGAACVLSYALFPCYQPDIPDTRTVTVGQVLRIGTPLMLPVSLLSGAFFTLAGSGIRSHFRSSRVSAGLLTLFNTVGAALGTIVAGFVLIPRLGMESSLFLASLLYGVAGGLWSLGRRDPRKSLYAIAILWVIGLASFPFGSMRDRHLPHVADRWCKASGCRLAGIREGRTETLMYVEVSRFGRPIYYQQLANSFSMSATDVRARRYMKEFAYWPLALHPHPRRALLLCFGLGSTARALADSPDLESIDVVDISRDILETSAIVYPDPGDSPLRDPRVRVRIEDGRYFLQASRERFDLITGEPPPPINAGVASLYSKEYFRLIYDHLAENGMVTYWLPLHDLSEQAALSVLRAFADVFHTGFLWHGAGTSIMVVGIRVDASRVSEEHFARQWRDPRVAAEMAALGFETPAQLGSGFIGDGDYVRAITRDSPPLTDDHPKRILTGGRDSGSLFRAWVDADAARERFVRSRAIRGFWPPGWFDRTLPFFDIQKVATTFGGAARLDGFPDYRELHRLITGTQSVTLPLWILGSSSDLQRAVGGTDPAHRDTPEIRHQIGIGLLARREYAAAAEHLRGAIADPKIRRVAAAACLYALCMADRREEARILLEQIRNDPETRSIPQSYWAWMRETFGLSIPS